jgi:uncharacterized protein (DUF305 family)
VKAIRNNNRHFVFGATVCCSLLLAVGCKGSDPAPTVSSGAPANAGDSGSSGSTQTATATAPTGDPDRDFLHVMINHHAGLSEIIHSTSDRTEDRDVLEDARLIDHAQDGELTQMGEILERDFKDVYTPVVMEDDRKMAADIAAQSGANFARSFYRDVVAHHERGNTMINEYLPKLRNAAVKKIAQQMKSDHAKEIATYKAKLARIGG